MIQSSKISGLSPFNSIYVEDRAAGYPVTEKVLAKYPDCPVIPIKHYKDVFNRRNQHWGLQKQHPSLILAVKEEPFLYRGPEVCQNFGHSNFYYVSFLLNCLFDCEYCYLQGMYDSAYPVAFVNTGDFKTAIDKIASGGRAYLAASYDTDLLAFHSIIPYPDYLYDSMESNPDLLVELRTKSAGQIFYASHKPLQNLIIAFSLAPDEVIANYEKTTPSLDMRLKAVQKAIDCGFKVRLCFDPVISGTEIDMAYEPFFRHVFSAVDPDGILDVGYGFFRMPRDFFKRVMKRRTNSRIYLEDYPANTDIVTYSPGLRDKIAKEHIGILSEYLDSEKIFVLQEG